MTNTMIFCAMALLIGCSAHKPEPLPRPTGNMPMTEQEYQESQLFLLEKQKLPPDEHLRRRTEILGS